MTSDALLTRLLDRMDEVVADLATLNAKTEAIVQRLDKINGSVQKHEAELNENKIWRAAHESKPKISEKTILRVTRMVCGTVLTVFGAKITGLDEALVSLLK